MNNIIFLDIDGVLNMFGSSCRSFMKPSGQHIEPHLAQRMNYLCEKIDNIKLVISSSWKGDMDDLQKQLEEQGFKYWNLVIGKTPKAYREHLDYSVPAKILLDKRGEQILEWIQKNEFKGKYLILDDEISDIVSVENIYPEAVFEVDSNEGLLHKDVMNIISFFEK